MRASDRVRSDLAFAERALFHRRLFRLLFLFAQLLVDLVYSLDNTENDKRRNEEIDNGSQKFSVGKHRRSLARSEHKM